MLKRAFPGAIAFLLIAVSALLGWRAIRQHQISAARAIAVPPGVDSLEPVRLGGVEQWIRIRGRDRTRPVLLFLHGGLCVPEMPLSYVNSALEESFVVVHSDERARGSGSTREIFFRTPLARVLCD